MNIYGFLLPLIANKYLNVFYFTFVGFLKIKQLNKKYNFEVFQASDAGAVLDAARRTLQESVGRHLEASEAEALTFEDVRRRVNQIAAVVSEGQMPPWKPQPGFGQFLNEQRLDIVRNIVNDILPIKTYEK